MANPFVHVELATTDVAKAKSFYQSLFDWTLKDEDMGGGMIYTMIGVGEGTGGGMMKHPMPEHGSSWLPYVLVDNITAATGKAKIARRHHRQGRDRGDGRGLVLDHQRSDRRRAGTVAAQIQVTTRATASPHARR